MFSLPISPPSKHLYFLTSMKFFGNRSIQKKNKLEGTITLEISSGFPV